MFTKNFTFCTRCAEKLGIRVVEGAERLVCPKCGYIQYLNPAPAVGVCIEQDGKVLLVQRSVEPKAGLWQIPAGFLEVDEDVTECAHLELKEETNLDVALQGLVGVYSVFDDPRYICLLVMYKGIVTGGELQPGDDAADAQFFSPDNLPDIAFACHRTIIEDFIKFHVTP